MKKLHTLNPSDQVDVVYEFVWYNRETTNVAIVNDNANERNDSAPYQTHPTRMKVHLLKWWKTKSKETFLLRVHKANNVCQPICNFPLTNIHHIRGNKYPECIQIPRYSSHIDRAR